MVTDLQDQSHKRFNILTGEWVLVSPHRAKRPWQGQEETPQKENRPQYDEHCYLCPGNERANGEKNPNYKNTHVFNNDFAAIKEDTTVGQYTNGLLHSTVERGICKVVCFSPDHSKTLAHLTINEIMFVVNTWQKEFLSLKQVDFINYVQIFENKGAVMGCSNPHPHGQIWAQSSLPSEVQKKDKHQAWYFNKHKTSLLGDYLQQELEEQERVIYKNAHFAILVPYWAIWPFETMIVPLKHQKDILELSEEEKQSFALAISTITQAYDKVFNCSFPYSSGIHQAPTNDEDTTYWHWHMSFYPPLLRSATVKKFMVGYEMFGMPQRDITPEKAAELLRKLVTH